MPPLGAPLRHVAETVQLLLVPAFVKSLNVFQDVENYLAVPDVYTMRSGRSQGGAARLLPGFGNWTMSRTTESATPSGSQYVDFDEFVDFHLDKARLMDRVPFQPNRMVRDHMEQTVAMKQTFTPDEKYARAQATIE